MNLLSLRPFLDTDFVVLLDSCRTYVLPQNHLRGELALSKVNVMEKASELLLRGHRSLCGGKFR